MAGNLTPDFLNSLFNPGVVAVVGFFILRLIRLLDDTAKARRDLELEVVLLKKDLDQAREAIGVLKRDQCSIWQKIDLLKERTHVKFTAENPSRDTV